MCFLQSRSIKFYKDCSHRVWNLKPGLRVASEMFERPANLQFIISLKLCDVLSSKTK